MTIKMSVMTLISENRTERYKIYYEPDIDKALVSVYGDIKPEMTCLYEKSCGAVVYK